MPNRSRSRGLRWLAPLAVLSTSILGIAPGVAWAEDEDKRFTWHPSVTATFIADDEPHLDDDSKGRLGGWLSPNLALGYRAESFELGADLGADLRRYIDDGSLAEEFWRASVRGEVGILPGLTFALRNDFAPQPERIASPADETTNLFQANQLDTTVRYWKELPGRRELNMGLRGTYFTGKEIDALLLTDGGGVVLEEDFSPERWEGAADIEFQNPFGERSAVYVRGQMRYRTFGESEVTDHADITLMAGLRTRRFRNIEIDVAAGWGVISFDSRDNVQRFVGEGSLRYRLPSGWTWRLSAANRFVADVSGNNFVETTGRMGLNRHFGELTSASAAIFVSRLENDAWDTERNWFGGAEVRVTQRLGRRTSLSVTYRYWRNDGDYSFDDFDQNRLALELTYRH